MSYRGVITLLQQESCRRCWTLLIQKRSFLPSSRWWRLRKDVFVKQVMENDYKFKSPTTLIDFSREEDAIDAIKAHVSNKFGGWRLSDDETIGGKSRAVLRLIESEKNLELFQEVPWQVHLENDKGKKDELDFFEERDENVVSKSDNSDSNKNNFTPFLRWKGKIDTSLHKESKFERSGFCSILSPDFTTFFGSMVLPYNALEIVCRSDGRTYFVNLKLDSWLPDNLYQAIIDAPPTNVAGTSVPRNGGDFTTLVLPFKNFLQTYGGRVREFQLSLDNEIAIETIGFTLADGKDGEFEFDIARVRAVNYVEDEFLD